MANSTTTAAAQASAAAKAKAAALKALKQQSHIDSAKYFAYGIAGIIALITIFHWSRIIYRRYASNSKALKLPVAVTRAFRGVFARKVPGFVSGGQFLVFLAYIAVCLSVTFCNIVDWSSTKEFAKRLGWVAAVNLFLVVFLSLKHTPLGFLTAYSHERLNPLHQVAGYSAIVFTLVHAVVYIHTWYLQNHIDEFNLMVQKVAYLSTTAMFVLVVTAFFLRKRQYELFHIIHSALAIIIITGAALHRPKIATKSVIILIIAGGIWGADRVLRTIKFALTAIGNNATITPLPHGGTRITMKKGLPFAVPGSHVFIWIPGVRAIESHPFTIVSTSPLEMVVAAYDGFTKDLHACALKNPKKLLIASVDGPYGAVPSFTSFTTVIFIAGGSGASFTAGVAIDLLRKLGDSTKTNIIFTWVVKDQEQLSWFAGQLQELSASPLVTMDIHSTSPVSTPTSPAEPKSSATPSEVDFDMEKQKPVTNPGLLGGAFDIRHGRPIVTDLIAGTVATASQSDRIAVVACGPDGMMLETQKSVASHIKMNGPAIELHSEHFGW